MIRAIRTAELSSLGPDDRAELEQARADALEWVNAEAESRGGRPLYALSPGTPNSPYSCAIAESLKDATATQYVRASYREIDFGNGDPVPTPERIAEFQAYFDAGLYPDLDLSTRARG